MPEFAPVINVATLNGANGFRLDGDAAEDISGSATAGAGDVNGDGLDDVLIGAPYSDTGGANRGLAWVVFGGASASSAQSLASRVAAGTAYRFQGEAAGDEAGCSISTAGDVNGDGFGDFIIGARLADPDAAGGDRGASYLIFGGGARLEAADAADGGNDNLIALANLAPLTGYRFDGGANGDRSGYSVSGAGDVNGDGIADLLIGAPMADLSARTNNGASYIVFGGTANLTDLDDDDGTADGRIDLVQISSGQGLRIIGDGSFAGDYSGRSVALVGDVNGDGFGDALIGAPYADPSFTDSTEGAAYLVFGNSQAQFAGITDIDLASLNGVSGTRFDGAAFFDRTGGEVNGLGDVNGDGFADIAISARSADFSYAGSGSVYVVFGKSAFGASSDLSALNGTNGFRLDGVREEDALAGFPVSSAGDVNGDGFADILVGAHGFDRTGATEVGAAFVVFGRATGFAAAIDLGSLDGNSGFRIEGAAGGDVFGLGIMGAGGDVNGDGFDDVIVGALGADNGVTGSGSTYIVYGHRAQSSVERIGTGLDNRINGGFGDDTVSGLDGNDTLIGWEDDDHMEGGAGNDTLDGGDGSDELKGGGGLDTFLASLGDDTVGGGSGGDNLDFAGIAGGGLTINLTTGAATLPDPDSSLVFTSIERLFGTASADRFTGDARVNFLNGRNGNDTLSGGAGDDVLVGGRNADIMTGGGGEDRFDFNATTESAGGVTRDTISDFVHLTDVIDLLSIDAVVGGGNDVFSFIGTAAFTAAGQVRTQASGSDTIIQMNTSGTSGVESSILLLGITASTVTEADFVL